MNDIERAWKMSMGLEHTEETQHKETPEIESNVLVQEIQQLEQERASLFTQLNANNKILSLKKNQHQQAIQSIRTANAVAELTEMREYLKKHTVYFGTLSIDGPPQLLHLYDIGYCLFSLPITNFVPNPRKNGFFKTAEEIRNMSISDISRPIFATEERVYPYVVEYLKPHLPITFDCQDNNEGYGFSARPARNAPISFQTNKGAYLYVYFYNPRNVLDP